MLFLGLKQYYIEVNDIESKIPVLLDFMSCLLIQKFVIYCHTIETVICMYNVVKFMLMLCLTNHIF